MEDMLLLYLGTVWTCLVLILGENIEPTSNMEQIFCAFIVRAAVFAHSACQCSGVQWHSSRDLHR